MAKTPYKLVKISSCIPNDWNANELDAEGREKLHNGIKLLLEQTGSIPPIVVRRHPDKPRRYQIIDGYHRWLVMKEAGYETIDSHVLDVDLQTAMLLTDTLNYLRGEPDPEKHAKYVQRLLEENKLPLIEAAEFLPESADELREILDNYDLVIEDVDLLDDMPPASAPAQDDAFVDIRFSVAVEQASKIEEELARIGKVLEGKNIRGRALEFMAAQSAQTVLPEMCILPDESDEHTGEVRRKLRHRAKRRKKSV